MTARASGRQRNTAGTSVLTLPKRRRGEPEHVEQAAFFAWVRQHVTRYPVLEELYAVPNGRKRSKAEAGKLKAEGVQPGRPDVNADYARREHHEEEMPAFHGLRLEFKAPGKLNALDPEQKKIIMRLANHGFCVRVVDDWRVAWNLVVWYFDLPTYLNQPLFPRGSHGRG